MTKLRRAVRIAVPMTLIVVGYSLLTGCFYVPTFSEIKFGPQQSAKLRKPTDLKGLIVVGKTTREEIEKLVGVPEVAEDPRQVYYTWTVQHGAWVFPLCFMAMPDTKSVSARLQFNGPGKDGVLEGYEVRDREPQYLTGNGTELSGGFGEAYLTKGVLSEPSPVVRKYDRYRYHPMTRPSTRVTSTSQPG